MIFDVIYKIYFLLKRKKREGTILKKFYIMFINYIEDFFNNKLVKYYQKNNNRFFLKKQNRDERIVASLTSYPKRISSVWITIETIINQSMQPDKIILWLAAEQFPNKYDDLPDTLLGLMNKGLTIKFCKDLKSHKKYYYAMKEYANDIVILFDDDMFYPRDTIKKLYKLHKKNPNDVCVITSQIITPSIYTLPSKWKNPDNIDNIKNSFNVQIFSGSGTLLLPNILNEKAFDEELINELCPYADDLWLTFMIYKNGKQISSLKKWRSFPVSIYGTSEDSLYYTNVSKGKNDEQWRNLIRYFPDDFKRWEQRYNEKH